MSVDDEPAPVMLLSTLAVQKALQDQVLPSFTARTGVRVEVTFQPTSVLRDAIAGGLRGDVLIAVSDYINGLAAAAILDHTTCTPLGSVRVGVAVAAGAPAPDITTVSSFRDALLNAESVAYSRTGASGIHFAGILGRLGVADAVNSKASILEKGLIGEALLDGRADLAIQQMSELAAVDGINIVGPLPDDLQMLTTFSAGVFTHSAVPDTAKALRDMLYQAESIDAYRASGLQPAVDDSTQNRQ